MRSIHCAWLFLCHIEVMRALKSKLATEILAESGSRAQLRLFLANRQGSSAGAQSADAEPFFIRREDGTRVEVKFVPKAGIPR
ncbi:hypothetical protein HSX11_17930 [Oxalobacteraceae bacterium]|nr:hypothetical protein [Oxalobacteraceae bacterium]